MKNKKIKVRQVVEDGGEARHMRQVTWAKAQHQKYLNLLWKIGQTFDQQPKHKFE